jgi:hypothetical protein
MIQHGIENRRIFRIGNFRRLFFHKRSYPESFSFSSQQPTVLYAPTWDDAEGNCTFWSSVETLSNNLPPSINLLVKPHPNTVLHHRPAIERLIGTLERSNLQFLLDSPPIFPLLARVDAYLGDRSSIGYDFLFFNRPLFFLDPHSSFKGRDLLSCGQRVTPDHFFDCFLSKTSNNFTKARQTMRRYAFDNISLLQMKKIIWEAINLTAAARQIR